MKNLRTKISYALLLIAGVFTSCDNNSFKEYDVIEIEGCEYIQYLTSYGALEITHKGNCKNEIHACN